eukprot:1062299-Prymnesium_polylepis.3
MKGMRMTVAWLTGWTGAATPEVERPNPNRPRRRRPVAGKREAISWATGRRGVASTATAALRAVLRAVLRAEGGREGSTGATAIVEDHPSPSRPPRLLPVAVVRVVVGVAKVPAVAEMAQGAAEMATVEASKVGEEKMVEQATWVLRAVQAVVHSMYSLVVHSMHSLVTPPTVVESVDSSHLLPQRQPLVHERSDCVSTDADSRYPGDALIPCAIGGPPSEWVRHPTCVCRCRRSYQHRPESDSLAHWTTTGRALLAKAETCPESPGATLLSRARMHSLLSEQPSIRDEAIC